jgi:autotransporter-associated beta strand protein
MTRTAFFSSTFAVAILSSGSVRGQLDPNAFTSLGTLNVSSGTLTINTDTLTMTGAASFTGVALNQNGGPQVAVFDFSSINIASGVTVSMSGSRPLALLSQGNATVQAPLTVGIAGYLGGTAEPFSGQAFIAGEGPGGGGAETFSQVFYFAGGGGFGGAGGSPAAGGTYGKLFQTLQGGSGGGAYASGNSGGVGGTGGGGLEISSVGTLSVSGTIAANGLAGSNSSFGGGGGGAGGGIVLSGRSGLSITSVLSANGGAGANGGATQQTGAGGGGGGRIALSGLGSYVLGQLPSGFNVNGGTGANQGGPGFAGVITVDATQTEVAPSTSVTLDGGPITAVVGSASQNSPTVEAYVRRDLLIFDSATVTLAVNNPLQHLDAAGNNVTDLNVEGTFNLNGFNQAINTLDNGTLFPGTVQLPAGSTLTVGTANGTSTFTGQFTGSGTLLKVGTGTQTLGGTFDTIGSPNFAGPTTVAGGVLGIAHNLELELSTVTLAGGSLSFSVTDPVFGGLAGADNLSLAGLNSLTVGGNNGSTTYSGNLSGSVAGGLYKTGTGTWTLMGTSTQSGPFNIQAGTVVGGASGVLSPNAPITVSSGATLDLNGYGYTVTSANSLTVQGTLRLSGGYVTVVSGATATYNGAAVMNGFLDGPGTFVVTGGAALSGVTTSASAVISQAGPASFVNFTNGGSLNVAAALTGPSSLSSFTNQGSGLVTVGANSPLNASDFQTYGTLTINPATVTQNFSQTTKVTNTGTTPLYFNGGSRTFIGTPATAVFPVGSPQAGQPTFVAGIDLNGKNAVVAGGLFVNNGYVEDSSNGFAGTSTVVADFGSLVKGAGFFQNSVQTINGGKFQAGNSPGASTFGRFVLGPGGVSNYVFAIDDATGTAGPQPDAVGHVSGWGLVKAIGQVIGAVTTPGDFTWTATPTDKLTVSLQTLVNPTTVGVDVPGLMDNFDPARSYVWPAVAWTGTYAGPSNAATLDAATAFDMGGFANPIEGSFSWALDAGGHTLSLTYTPTPVPEPGTFVLTGFVAGASWMARRRRRGSE